ncbi:MAG: NAD(+)/NADH kinase [bacterium]|nr:NAD(+)/NADH kinase [bacterium]
MKKPVVLSVYINAKKKNAGEVLDRLLIIGRKYNIRFLLLDSAVKGTRFSGLGVPAGKFIRECRYVIVIGGDGTFIMASHYFMDMSVPLLGINIGYFGFLTEVEENESEIEENIRNIIYNKIKIEERMVLKGELVRKGRVLKTFRALNEVVINHGSFTKIIKIRAYVNDQYIGTFAGDGVMVSTPTGSTGYSLSASGPIVNPHMDVFIFNTICPHTLTFRPLVISSDSCVVLENIHDQNNVILSFDGFKGIKLKKGDKIVIRRSKRRLKLITSPDRNFYDILREKFKWVE